MFKRATSSQQPPTLYAFPSSAPPPNPQYPYGAPHYQYQRPSAPPVAPGYSAAYGPPPTVDPRWNTYQQYQQISSTLQAQNQQQHHSRANSYSGYAQPSRGPQPSVAYPSTPHRVPPALHPSLPGPAMHPQQSSSTYPGTPSHPYTRPNLAHPYPPVPPQPPVAPRRTTYTQEYIDSLPPLPPGLKYFLDDATIVPSRGNNVPQHNLTRERSSSSAHDARLPQQTRTAPSRQHSSSSVHETMTFSQRLNQALNPGKPSSAHVPSTPRVYPQTPPHDRGRRLSSSSAQARPFVPPPHPRNSSPRSVTIPDSYAPSETSRVGHRPPTPKYAPRELPAEDREEREIYRPSELEKKNTFENSQTDRRHLIRKDAHTNGPKRQFSEMNYELLPTIRRDIYPHVEWYFAYPPNTAIHHIGPTQQIPLDMKQNIVHPPVRTIYIGSGQDFMKPLFKVASSNCIVIRLNREITVGDVFSAMYDFFQRRLGREEILAVKNNKELYELGRANRKRRRTINPTSSHEPIIQDLLEGPIKFNGFIFDSQFHTSSWIWLVVDRLA